MALDESFIYMPKAFKRGREEEGEGGREGGREGGEGQAAFNALTIHPSSN